ncbi:MAG: hypothetical protein RMY16_30505 [Nostoc sp. DedQUE12b]|nr:MULTISPECIES: hypothetical protein [unclassified Nostoc]MDZ7951314.1 hypothetical protein [Nostoc sp. DedQUE09]MDZ8089850.1 hypothetical protein [Nostoc sp. DedQUE12b]
MMRQCFAQFERVKETAAIAPTELKCAIGDHYQSTCYCPLSTIN